MRRTHDGRARRRTVLRDPTRFDFPVATKEQARSIAELPVGFPRWPAAIRAIAAHPLYDGLVLEPQMGLVPLGPDPVSTLWEFTVLHTGEIPGRGPGERLETTASGAIVVVLLGR